MPVNAAANTIAKIALANGESDLRYYHVENPTPTPWSTIARAISQDKGANLPYVSFIDWLSRLRERRIEDAGAVPAVRLLDFFVHAETAPALSVANTLALAPEVDFGQINSDILAQYLAYQNSGTQEPKQTWTLTS